MIALTVIVFIIGMLALLGFITTIAYGDIGVAVFFGVVFCISLPIFIGCMNAR